MKIALITACLAGVAHSKMAALALKKEAKIRGHEICVEEQGGHKIPVKISKEQIEERINELNFYIDFYISSIYGNVMGIKNKKLS